MRTFLMEAIHYFSSVVSQKVQTAQDSILGLDYPDEATTELNQQVEADCQDLHDLEIGLQ